LKESDETIQIPTKPFRIQWTPSGRTQAQESNAIIWNLTKPSKTQDPLSFRNSIKIHGKQQACHISNKSLLNPSSLLRINKPLKIPMKLSRLRQHCKQIQEECAVKIDHDPGYIPERRIQVRIRNISENLLSE
jgi:hypothetical protein